MCYRFNFVEIFDIGFLFYKCEISFAYHGLRNAGVCYNIVRVLVLTATCRETVFRDAAGGKYVPVARHTGVRRQGFAAGQTEKGTVPATIAVVHSIAPVKGKTALKMFFLLFLFFVKQRDRVNDQSKIILYLNTLKRLRTVFKCLKITGTKVTRDGGERKI